MYIGMNFEIRLLLEYILLRHDTTFGKKPRHILRVNTTPIHVSPFRRKAEGLFHFGLRTNRRKDISRRFQNERKVADDRDDRSGRWRHEAVVMSSRNRFHHISPLLRVPRSYIRKSTFHIVLLPHVSDDLCKQQKDPPTDRPRSLQFVQSNHAQSDFNVAELLQHWISGSDVEGVHAHGSKDARDDVDRTMLDVGGCEEVFDDADHPIRRI